MGIRRVGEGGGGSGIPFLKEGGRGDPTPQSTFDTFPYKPGEVWGGGGFWNLLRGEGEVPDSPSTPPPSFPDTKIRGGRGIHLSPQTSLSPEMGQRPVCSGGGGPFCGRHGGEKKYKQAHSKILNRT